jgi:hypothetical protein
VFALLALLTFVLALFGVALGSVNLVILGLVFISAHLLVGLWPLGAVGPWRRQP